MFDGIVVCPVGLCEGCVIFSDSACIAKYVVKTGSRVVVVMPLEVFAVGPLCTEIDTILL